MFLTYIVLYYIFTDRQILQFFLSVQFTCKDNNKKKMKTPLTSLYITVSLFFWSIFCTVPEQLQYRADVQYFNKNARALLKDSPICPYLTLEWIFCCLKRAF